MNLAHFFTSNFSLIAGFLILLIAGRKIELREPTQYIQFLLGECGQKATYANGRYFYSNNLRYLREDTDTEPAAKAIIDFNSQLKNAKIRLIVIPVPSKAGISRSTPGQDLLKELDEAGVETINLWSILSDSCYLQRDTHWNLAGIERTAWAIAERLGKSEQKVGEELTVQHRGDIIEMMDSEFVNLHLGWENVHCKRFRLDGTHHVLLIGDSFLGIFNDRSAGLASHVGSYLWSRPKSIINDGGGATLVRQRLASKPEMLENTSTLIWVFAARDIRFGLDGWRDVRVVEASK